MDSDHNSPSGIAKYLQPRFLLLVWMGLGGLFLAVVLVMAMIPVGENGPDRERAYALHGEMSDFMPAFPPREAPAIPFKGPEGNDLSLRDFRGRVVLVNVWATWCAPCLEEMPSLDTLQAELGSDDFQVVAIAAEPRAEERVMRFFSEHEIEHLSFYSDPLLSFATTVGGADVLPVSILYDRRGTEIGRLVGGADWASDEAKGLIRAAIEGREIG